MSKNPKSFKVSSMEEAIEYFDDFISYIDIMGSKHGLYSLKSSAGKYTLTIGKKYGDGSISFKDWKEFLMFAKNAETISKSLKGKKINNLVKSAGKCKNIIDSFEIQYSWFDGKEPPNAKTTAGKKDIIITFKGTKSGAGGIMFEKTDDCVKFFNVFSEIAKGAIY